ncbi:TIGR04282 family arsenosugar biosynthesis glycosyltransferase [candidate division KSB1 bacterium]|nr:TIGR04282 family arsenosugar biosynthesis glycosyltransferase [candidate division KSB1 bacterium]
MNRKSDNALILFVKAPRLGTVKTRLQPELTAGQSLRLYQAMVEDLVRQFDDVGYCDLKIFFHPTDAYEEMKNWLGEKLDYFPQQGKNLGEKMLRAITEMSERRYKKVALVGSDIPTLDSATLARAFSSLNEYDVVIGPSNDGGYYLIGMKHSYPVLFSETAWSSNLVFQQTIQNARSAAIEVVQLEKKSDIDTYHDVVELWNYVKKRNVKGAFSFKSKTYDVLKTFFEMKNSASQ